MKKYLQIASVVVPVVVPFIAPDVAMLAAKYPEVSGAVYSAIMLLNALAPSLKGNK